ncbi:MAG: ABC transporter permease [Cryobacterium sp.]|uniref:ABC transporter permease n=1 Tax=unclassified Chelatococcus TaxID=2638111 RepID=UPI001BD14164|nr:MULTISPECIES: ABC transporter permease [unclassified Chelatococcus]MBX3088026.1 ABC transporter permease [Cryobacterium sp.]CAH1648539.1 Dipeptide transport system permease protein DppC [Hyphomicrobiales bacterium]MBS7741917.1 ABC transporter permease [Chelatococcus sp. HY11]MBX3541285.1 ABC transporter permease [Chelatococcus sp.]MCO5074822.1 ABC transporter permease [Chelatococcus sp.]
MVAVHIPTGPGTTEAEQPRQSVTRKRIKAFLRAPGAVFGLALFGLFLILALFAPQISPQNPYDLDTLDIMDNMLAPGSALGNGITAWLGTDDQGRDMLSAILHGLRISIGVGVVSVLIASAIGAVVGIGCAYLGGRVDAIAMRIVDLQLSFPSILVALVLLSVFGRGIDKVILALVIVQWAYYARTVRGSALVEREKDYIAAAVSFGAPRWRIMFRHLLPNCLPPLIVIATVQIAHAISLEATLSFLGVGVPVTEPSLGMLIANGYGYLLSGKYWISTFPGFALLLLVLAINLVGDRLRHVMDPYSDQNGH